MNIYRIDTEKESVKTGPFTKTYDTFRHFPKCSHTHIGWAVCCNYKSSVIYTPQANIQQLQTDAHDRFIVQDLLTIAKREREDSAILSGVIIVVFVIRNIKKDTIVLVITKGPRHSRLFYFLWQYVTPGRFQLNFKLFISPYLDNSGSYYGLLTSRSNKITTFVFYEKY